MHATKTSLITAGLLAASVAGAQFSDDFNRADAPDLGPNWTVIGTGSATRVISNQAGNVVGSNNLSLVNVGNFSSTYDMTQVRANVFHSGVSGLGYVALAMGHNGGTTAGNGLFIKVQSNGGAMFDFIGMYTGIGSGSTTYWTDPPVFFAATTPFTSARMTVWASSATTINLGLDTDFNGIDDQVYSRNLNLGLMTFGTQAGIGVYGTVVKADDFSASAVPEPATIAVVSLGLLALLRRRNK